MIRAASSELVKRFLAEHRTFMRSLSSLLKTVKSGDLATARRLADTLDQLAGPHIQFEEEILYPEVGRARGGDLQRKLKDEHTTMCNAIRQLLSPDVRSLDDPQVRDPILADLAVAVEHAGSCGTLIGHLQDLSTPQQAAALERLEALHAQGRRWTELSDSSGS